MNSAPPKLPNTKSENANANIIGMLVGVISGTLAGMPEGWAYTNDKDLLDIVCPQLQGYPGCSRRNLEAKFAEGRRALGLPLPDKKRSPGTRQG